MSKTIRWYQKYDMTYNPYWHRHELKDVRIALHRRYRHRNKIAIKNGIDIELERRTTGWVTY